MRRHRVKDPGTCSTAQAFIMMNSNLFATNFRANQKRQGIFTGLPLIPKKWWAGRDNVPVERNES
jgi:hypothetical protein